MYMRPIYCYICNFSQLFTFNYDITDCFRGYIPRRVFYYYRPALVKYLFFSQSLKATVKCKSTLLKYTKLIQSKNQV